MTARGGKLQRGAVCPPRLTAPPRRYLRQNEGAGFSPFQNLSPEAPKPAACVTWGWRGPVPKRLPSPSWGGGRRPRRAQL